MERKKQPKLRKTPFEGTADERMIKLYRHQRRHDLAEKICEQGVKYLLEFLKDFEVEVSREYEDDPIELHFKIHTHPREREKEFTLADVFDW